MKRPVMVSSLVAIVVTVAFSSLLITRHPLGAVVTPSPLLGKAAPALSGRELDGGTFNLSQHRGQIVVVNFWASWCVPCVKEAPELSAFAWRERHRGVILIGVVFNDTLSSARSFEHRYGSLYPSLTDPGGAMANSYGVSGPPTTFVIDRHGRVAITLLGPASAKQLLNAVSRVSQ